MQKPFLYMAILLISSHAYAIVGEFGMSAGENLVKINVTGVLNDNRSCTINDNNKID